MILTEFVKTSPKLLEKIKEAVDIIAYDEISKLAHQLKGSSGNLRINVIYELAIELENSAKNKEIRKCKSYLTQIHDVFH